MKLIHRQILVDSQETLKLHCLSIVERRNIMKIIFLRNTIIVIGVFGVKFFDACLCELFMKRLVDPVYAVREVTCVINLSLTRNNQIDYTQPQL